MGVNLILYQVTHERAPNWDSIRRAGDREFSLAPLEKEYISVGHPRDGEVHWRPKNINDAIKWVKENVPQINQKRLVDVLEDMRENCDLYFCSSW